MEIISVHKLVDDILTVCSCLVTDPKVAALLIDIHNFHIIVEASLQ